MEVKDSLHMSKGDGELSYYQNSSVQGGVWCMNQHIVESAIQSLFSAEKCLSKVLNVVDLGCGVGPVPLALVSLLLNILQKKCKEFKSNSKSHPPPKLQMYMNDLPSNDFNLLFKDLLNSEILKTKDDDDVPSCFLRGAPGSYYNRLFPDKTLHFVHANYALHWLSQVPLGLYNEQGIPINKGNIYVSETSSKAVAKAYWAQFEDDFTKFLICRSEEVVSNGCMLLTLRGRPCSTDSLTWTSFELKILSEALNCLVSKGIIREEKLDTFNFPCYHACTQQLENIAKKEGSFSIEESKTLELDIAPEIEDKWRRAQIITNFIRAFSESLVSHHFGEDILSPLYDDKLIYYSYQHLVHDQPVGNHAVTILLRRK